MNLSDIHIGVQGAKKTKRLGRGKGTGQGKTGGHGHKGQGQRAGWSSLPVFEGGQFPLVRRVPKRGFNNRWALEVRAINVADLEALFESGDEVTPESLATRGIIRGRYDVLKVLGDGDLTKKLKITAHRFSTSAKAKIEAAGGECIVLGGPAPVVRNKMGSKKGRGPKKPDSAEPDSAE